MEHPIQIRNMEKLEYTIVYWSLVASQALHRRPHRHLLQLYGPQLQRNFSQWKVVQVQLKNAKKRQGFTLILSMYSLNSILWRTEVKYEARNLVFTEALWVKHRHILHALTAKTSLGFAVDNACKSPLLPFFWCSPYTFGVTVAPLYCFQKFLLCVFTSSSRSVCAIVVKLGIITGCSMESHKGVDRTRVAALEESVTQIPFYTEQAAILFVGLRTANMRFCIFVTY